MQYPLLSCSLTFVMSFGHFSSCLWAQILRIVWEKCFHALVVLFFKVFNQLPKSIFAWIQYETHCQVPINGVFFSLVYLLIFARFFPFDAASTSEENTTLIWQYGWRHRRHFGICPCTLEMTCFDPVLLFSIYLLLQTMPVPGFFVIDNWKPGFWLPLALEYIFLYSGSAWILCLISSVNWPQITEYSVFMLSSRTRIFCALVHFLFPALLCCHYSISW